MHGYLCMDDIRKPVCNVSMLENSNGSHTLLLKTLSPPRYLHGPCVGVDVEDHGGLRRLFVHGLEAHHHQERLAFAALRSCVRACRRHRSSN